MSHTSKHTLNTATNGGAEQSLEFLKLLADCHPELLLSSVDLVNTAEKAKIIAEDLCQIANLISVVLMRMASSHGDVVLKVIQENEATMALTMLSSKKKAERQAETRS